MALHFVVDRATPAAPRRTSWISQRVVLVGPLSKPQRCVPADRRRAEPAWRLNAIVTAAQSAHESLSIRHRDSTPWVDLKGRLSNPLDLPESLAAQGSERIDGKSASVETTRIRPSNDYAEGAGEEKGRLSNPPQRRLSPACIDGLVEAYRAGATINGLAVELGIHRTTVAGHLDRKGVPRRSEATAWDDNALREAAELYATGVSLADVAHHFGVDAQTVANRFRRAGVPVRPRRGGTLPAHSERERG